MQMLAMHDPCYLQADCILGFTEHRVEAFVGQCLNVFVEMLFAAAYIKQTWARTACLLLPVQ